MKTFSTMSFIMGTTMLAIVDRTVTASSCKVATDSPGTHGTTETTPTGPTSKSFQTVTSLQARVQGDMPQWNADNQRFVSEYYTTFDEQYRAVLDTVNMAAVEGPTSSLIGPSTLLSILGQEMINVIFLVSGMYMLTSQRWYCPFSPDNIDLAKWWLLSDNHLATTLFFTIITQQQVAAWVFSFGSRFRASIWQNYPLVLIFGILTALDIYLLLGPPGKLTDIFRVASGTNVIVMPDIPMPLAFRVQYFVLLVGNVIAAILFEYFVVLGPVRDRLRHRFHKDQLPMPK
ncbi:hypothetical protein F444_13078 [Phytophthora nicotianae P1976]|uniref:Uncharacterized protein n=1 Tax=Phytophthora nicotianae P1976 TaxID=1317066 RepID=A0A080ZUV0_PHYNI|nr:hypothetical protein F444_13078 [Phytophthora nicotianae P1976]